MSPLFSEVHFPILFSLSPAPLGSLMSLMRCSLPSSHQSLSVQGFLPVPAAGHLLGGSAVPKGRMLPGCLPCSAPQLHPPLSAGRGSGAGGRTSGTREQLPDAGEAATDLSHSRGWLEEQAVMPLMPLSVRRV